MGGGEEAATASGSAQGGQTGAVATAASAAAANSERATGKQGGAEPPAVALAPGEVILVWADEEFCMVITTSLALIHTEGTSRELNALSAHFKKYSRFSLQYRCDLSYLRKPFFYPIILRFRFLTLSFALYYCFGV